LHSTKSAIERKLLLECSFTARVVRRNKSVVVVLCVYNMHAAAQSQPK